LTYGQVRYYSPVSGQVRCFEKLILLKIFHRRLSIWKEKSGNRSEATEQQDGAGVNLVRVLGNRTVQEYDPILMLDSFDSINPDDYTAGFPMHSHRGIEIISYVYRGFMTHKDSLGNEDTIGDGEVQWMTAGSGIMHEEKLPAAERLLGVQLWLNLPAKDKMVPPAYHSIKNPEIEEIEFDWGKLRLLLGISGIFIILLTLTVLLILISLRIE